MTPTRSVPQATSDLHYNIIEHVVEHIAHHYATTFPKAWNTSYEDHSFGPTNSKERARRIDAKRKLISEIADALL